MDGDSDCVASIYKNTEKAIQQDRVTEQDCALIHVDGDSDCVDSWDEVDKTIT